MRAPHPTVGASLLTYGRAGCLQPAANGSVDFGGLRVELRAANQNDLIASGNHSIIYQAALRWVRLCILTVGWDD